MDDLAGMDYEVSVASLRLDDLTPDFVFKLADTGVQGLTLAPECGSDRMRKILNKPFTNEEILDKATWIFENGIQNLKLYYMVGLPFEEHADVEAIVDLTAQIRERMLKVARGRGRIGRLHPSVNPFVPKPGTPYQWLPMENPKETDRKLQYLRKAFGRMPNVNAVIKSARTGAAQSMLALADRRVADALEIAVEQGVDLKRAVREAGPRPGLLPLPRAARRTRSCPGTSSTTGSARPTSGRSSSAAAPQKLSPHCPEIQGCIRCGVCVETPNPFYTLPGEVEGPRDAAALREARGSVGLIAPDPLVGGPVRRRPSSTRRRGRRPRRSRPRRGPAARPPPRGARSRGSPPRRGA